MIEDLGQRPIAQLSNGLRGQSFGVGQEFVEVLIADLPPVLDSSRIDRLMSCCADLARTCFDRAESEVASWRASVNFIVAGVNGHLRFRVPWFPESLPTANTGKATHIPSVA